MYNFTTMFNFRRAADYLFYRFKAKTRHGTHSPFVYRLVDKVIYDFSAKKVYDELKLSDSTRSVKLNQLLYRLAADWKPETIIELGQPLGITSQYLQKAAPDARVYTGNKFPDKPGLIFINTDKGEEALTYFEQSLPKINANTMLIIDNIHANEGMKQAWAKLKANPHVTVTIDLFWIGLVYFRIGQVKENFIIKI